MKMIIREQIESRQRRIANRLDKENYPEDLSQPMMRGPSPQFELSGRMVGTAYGGIGLIHQFVKELGLADAQGNRASNALNLRAFQRIVVRKHTLN